MTWLRPVSRWLRLLGEEVYRCVDLARPVSFKTYEVSCEGLRQRAGTVSKAISVGRTVFVLFCWGLVYLRSLQWVILSYPTQDVLRTLSFQLLLPLTLGAGGLIPQVWKRSQRSQRSQRLVLCCDLAYSFFLLPGVNATKSAATKKMSGIGRRVICGNKFGLFGKLTKFGFSLCKPTLERIPWAGSAAWCRRHQRVVRRLQIGPNVDPMSNVFSFNGWFECRLWVRSVFSPGRRKIVQE